MTTPKFLSNRHERAAAELGMADQPDLFFTLTLVASYTIQPGVPVDFFTPEAKARIETLIELGLVETTEKIDAMTRVRAVPHVRAMELGRP